MRSYVGHHGTLSFLLYILLCCTQERFSVFSPHPIRTRLGVGAPIPETHASAQARLVQKLEGGKKRARETANGDAVGVKKGEDGDEESSAEESRIGTTRKRTIIDPFEVAGKRRKKRRKEAEEIREATQTTAQEGSQMVGEGMVDPFDATAGPTPKKKRKKKKRPLPEGQETVEHNGEPRAAQNEGALAQSPRETLEALQQEIRDEPSEVDTLASPSSAPFPTLPEPTFDDLPTQRSLTDTMSTGKATLPYPSILNLTYPPSVAPEGTESHPRKKRRRKRKKRRAIVDPP